MTGAAQRSGVSDRDDWTWDVRTVNAKGLDVRLRLPPGLEAIEIEARRRIAGALARGTCHATLNVSRGGGTGPRAKLDLDLLRSFAEAVAGLERPAGIGPATLDGLLGLKGVVEIVEGSGAGALPPGDPLPALCLAGLDDVLAALRCEREREGAALRMVLADRIDAIERLTRAADDAPQRRPDAMRAKLAAQLDALIGQHGLDPARLHAEAVLLAGKADVREELDRLHAHVAAARALLERGGPVGRRLDFLAQEMGREASTLCAKSADIALTAIGLELRVEIEQLREQVQNIE